MLIHVRPDPVGSTNSRKPRTEGPLPTAEQLFREVRALPEAAGWSNSKVSRQVRAWLAHQRETGQTITAQDYIRLTYDDPTGETAARNVDRRRAGVAG